MTWKIISDSACDLKSADVECEKVGFTTIPFVLTIGDKNYVDNEELIPSVMLDDMESTQSSSYSACPSPQAWESEFEKADNCIAITISSNLSGSYNSARVGMENTLANHPEKNIYVLDSLSTGPESAMCIFALKKWIEEGLAFDEIITKAEALLAQTHTAFALCSFDNLVKSGRMNKLVGFVAKTLGMWGVGIASDQGTISIKGKARGHAKAISIIINYMEDCNFNGGEAIVSHCYNSDIAEKLKDAILAKWPTASVTLLETRGLDSYYAERKGIIIGFR